MKELNSNYTLFYNDKPIVITNKQLIELIHTGLVVINNKRIEAPLCDDKYSPLKCEICPTGVWRFNYNMWFNSSKGSNTGTYGAVYYIDLKDREQLENTFTFLFFLPCVANVWYRSLGKKKYVFYIIFDTKQGKYIPIKNVYTRLFPTLSFIGYREGETLPNRNLPTTLPVFRINQPFFSIDNENIMGNIKKNIRVNRLCENYSTFVNKMLVALSFEKEKLNK